MVTAGATQIVVPAPNDLQDGDIVILYIAHISPGTSPTIDTPAGFSEGDTASAANFGTSEVFVKEASGEGSDWTVTISTVDGSRRAYGVALAFYDAEIGTTPDDWDQLAAIGGDPPTEDFPEVANGLPEVTVVYCGAVRAFTFPLSGAYDNTTFPGTVVVDERHDASRTNFTVSYEEVQGDIPARTDVGWNDGADDPSGAHAIHRSLGVLATVTTTGLDAHTLNLLLEKLPGVELPFLVHTRMLHDPR